MKASQSLNTEETLTNLIPCGVFQVLYDDSFTIMYANPAFYQIIGLSRDKFIKKYEHKVRNVLLKGDWAYLYHSVKEAEENKELFFQIGISLPVRREGTDMYIVRGAFSKIHSNIVLNCILLNVSSEVVARKAQERAENFLNVALANSDVVVWEWDFLSSKCVFDKSFSLSSFNPKSFDNIPESLIETGYVADDSLVAFRKLHERVKSSQVSQQEDIHLLVNGSDVWVRINYTPSIQIDNKPKSAIGISKNITRQKKAEIRYSHAIKYQLSELDGVLAYCEYNITKKRFVSFKDTVEDFAAPVFSQSSDFVKASEWIISLLIANVPYREDILKIQSVFSKEQFLKALNGKEKAVAVEYRRNTKDGAIIWVMATCRFVEDLTSHEMTAFAILKNIDKQKKVELSLRSRVEHDLVSGFYNQETVSAVIDKMIQNGIESDVVCAILIFDIDNYLSLMNTSGYNDCRNVLKELAQLIDRKFSESKISGRIEGDEYLVFLYDNQNEEKIIKIAEDIRITISMPYLFPVFPVTISCGLVFSTIEGQSYESFLSKARVALNFAKKQGKNRIEVYKEHEIFEKQNFNQKVLEDNGTTELEESIFSEKKQKDLLLKMAFTLSEIKAYGNSMRIVLQSIAKYFSSKESFLLQFDENGQISEKYYFLDENIKKSKNRKKTIQEMNEVVCKSFISGLKSNRVMIVADTIILKGSFSKEYVALEEVGINSFILSAITKNDIVSGYVGVSNPKWNLKDKPFFQVIGYFLSNELEKHRIIEHQKYLVQHDSLTGFYTRDFYETYKSRFSGDSIISLGFIYCKLQDLIMLNHQYGYVYGDSLILFITDMMKQLFPNGRKYRYSGDSFVILVENMQLDSFYSKITELKIECGKSFENLIFVGYSWSDYEINIDDLFLHAGDRLLHDKQVLERNVIQKNDTHHKMAYQKLVQEIKEDRYAVFLQPKANCSDASVSGAEALIRYFDTAGKLVRPDSFIPFFESEGLVAEIDLFVLDVVNKILQRWMNQGKKLLPISLNFSRATMMDDKLFEKIEKIQNKYTIPREYIEIEMTETLGNIDEAILIRVGKKIAGLGYGLTLDDFGARYSNLSILTSMPFNVLKLDKTLVRDIFFNSRTKIVVQSFLLTCSNLGIRSIAEGVENQEQFEVLKKMGCDLIQGYLINKPIPIKEFEEKYKK